MSLLWRDQVRIVLCPDRLIAVRLGRGLRRKVAAKQVFPFPGEAGDWKAALAMLAVVLKQPSWKNADAVIILSSRFARYQLLPWSEAVLNDAERQALARHMFMQTYGESAASLELRIGDASFGAHSVVAGVERELLAGIEAVFNETSLKLVSIQPYLMSAFNGWRSRLSRDAQWFALIEPGMICAALLHRGGWHRLRVKQVSESRLEELQRMLHRERISDGVAENAKKVSVYMPDDQEIALPAGADWSFTRLQLPPVPGFSPAQDGLYGMTLAGAL